MNVSTKKRRLTRFLKYLLVFAVFFTAALAVIQIDTRASSVIGNESVFDSSFIRFNSREVEIKVLGFSTELAGGIAVK